MGGSHHLDFEYYLFLLYYLSFATATDSRFARCINQS